jgi:Tol biopolymer transport system component
MSNAEDREPAAREVRSGQRGRVALAALALAVAVAVAVAAVGLVRVLHERGARGLPKNGKIAFLGGDQPGSFFGRSDVYVMNPDGTGLTQLTTGDFRYLQPDWSPDGAMLAAVRTGGEFPPWFIVSMNADGSDLRQLTSGTALDTTPAWAPDGTAIVFARATSSEYGSAPYHLQSIDLDGSHLVPLMFNYGNENALYPTWAPDGQKIAYIGWTDPSGAGDDLFVMSPDGTGVTRLTDDGTPKAFVRWSPDGSHIAFMQSDYQQSDGTSVSSVILLDVNDGGRRTIYECRAPCAWISGLTWSPDGTKLVFSASTGTQEQYSEDIYVMDADGTGVTKLGTGSLPVCCPSWQPVP